MPWLMSNVDPMTRERLITWALRLGFTLVGAMTIYILALRS